MKAGFLCVAIVWAAAAAAQVTDPAWSPAPGPDVRQESPAERMDHLATLLDLTDAQKAQVQAVLQGEHAKLNAMIEQAKSSGEKLSQEQIRTAYQQLRQEMFAKLTPVLNPTQLKNFQILIQERDARGPGGPHPGPPPDGAPRP